MPNLNHGGRSVGFLFSTILPFNIPHRYPILYVREILKMLLLNKLIVAPCYVSVLRRTISYVQGQSPSPKLREYFYYIDHQGQLFLDDTKMKNFVTCFKDKKFLKFFFKRLKQNKDGKYKEDFPYISPCGREINYIRCDDVPVVFATIIDDPEREQICPGLLTYSGTGDGMTFPFQPEKVCMLPESGRIYHPAPEKIGGVGLIKSSLAIEISPRFEYQHGTIQEQDPPTHLNWKGVCYTLDNSLWKVMKSSEVEELKKRTGVE